MKIFVPILFAASLLGCNSGNSNNNDSQTDVQTIPTPANIGYQVVNKYPHDTTSFTEGFLYDNGLIYESAGEYGTSALKIYKLGDTKDEKSVKLDKQYFGEGTVLLDGKIYLLTYREHAVFVYDAKTLQKINTFSWPNEGWGMTTDGKHLIITTGDSNLYFVDPTTFKILNTVGVSDNYGPVSNLNEVEYVDGAVYANIWQTNMIYKINPANGSVLGKLDLTDINTKNGINFTPNGDAVLNGIAYIPGTKNLLVTGKNWPAIFELKL